MNNSNSENGIRELSLAEMRMVSGGGWQDIECTVGTSGADCTGTLGDFFGAFEEAVDYFNDIGSDFGAWLYDQYNPMTI